MSMTDPLSDMLTRLRNAGMARFEKVDVPFSNVKVSIVKILKDEGFVKNYKIIKEMGQTAIRIYLKYEGSKSVIKEIKRISKPSRRIYVRKDEIPKIRQGLGIAIVSTSKGVMADRAAREAAVGGELLCQVW
ncbi:MAG: 30S ribosomal protein S8 [Pseudomonadota bacterium]